MIKKHKVVFVLLLALSVPVTIFAYEINSINGLETRIIDRVSKTIQKIPTPKPVRISNSILPQPLPVFATTTTPDHTTPTPPNDPPSAVPPPVSNPATTSPEIIPPAATPVIIPPIVTPPPIQPASGWKIKSIDVMKYSKDVVCNPPSRNEIDIQVKKAVDLGANFVSISGFYDDPACAPDLPLITAWVDSIRAHDLNVWFRMKDLNFEGDYSVPKGGSQQSHIHAMTTWINANKALIKPNDIFTPFAEIQNGGIRGVSYCALGVCQFQNAADFNAFIRTVQSTVKNLLPGIKVGYYGFDGFIAAGVGNPDWEGRSQLEPATIASMDEVTIDHYPEVIGHTFAQDLPIFHRALGANVPLMIGEYGTITATSEQAQVNEINKELPMLKADPGVIGMNYWDLGPSGHEALVNSDYSNKPGFAALKEQYR